MCTSAETVVTTTSITAVSVSTRKAQSAAMPPERMKSSTCTLYVCSWMATSKNANHDSKAEIIRNAVVRYIGHDGP
jgi:hypothetical protein